MARPRRRRLGKCGTQGYRYPGKRKNKGVGEVKYEGRGVNNGGVEGPVHWEKRFTAREVVCDVIIGMSDGLTVPVALVAGLSAATVSSSIIITAGLAEVAAGAISMGLDGTIRSRNPQQEVLR